MQATYVYLSTDTVVCQAFFRKSNYNARILYATNFSKQKPIRSCKIENEKIHEKIIKLIIFMRE